MRALLRVDWYAGLAECMEKELQTSVGAATGLAIDTVPSWLFCKGSGNVARVYPAPKLSMLARSPWRLVPLLLDELPVSGVGDELLDSFSGDPLRDASFF